MRAANSFCAAGVKFGCGDGGRVDGPSGPIASRLRMNSSNDVAPALPRAAASAPRRRVHRDASRPSAGRLVAVRVEPVVDQVQERERVALAEELSLWPRRQPHDVALRAQLGGGLTREAEVVEPVARHHLLPVAPHAVVGAERSLARDVGARPVHTEVRRVLRGREDERAVADADAPLPRGQRTGCRASWDGCSWRTCRPGRRTVRGSPCATPWRGSRATRRFPRCAPGST